MQLVDIHEAALEQAGIMRPRPKETRLPSTEPLSATDKALLREMRTELKAILEEVNDFTKKFSPSRARQAYRERTGKTLRSTPNPRTYDETSSRALETSSDDILPSREPGLMYIFRYFTNRRPDSDRESNAGDSGNPPQPAKFALASVRSVDFIAAPTTLQALQRTFKSKIYVTSECVQDAHTATELKRYYCPKSAYRDLTQQTA